MIHQVGADRGLNAGVQSIPWALVLPIYSAIGRVDEVVDLHPLANGQHAR